MPQFDENDVDQQLQTLHLKEEEELARVLSKKYNLLYLNLNTITIDANAAALVPEEQARDAELAVIQITGKKIKVVIRNPNLEQAKEIIDNLKRKHYQPEIFMVSRHSLEKAWEKYREVNLTTPLPQGIVSLEDSSAAISEASLRTIPALRAALEPLVISEEERKTTATIETLLLGALEMDASDIHIEAEEQTTRLRLRLDGVLHDVMFFNARAYTLLLSRIKLLSGIKINIKNSAQDGRFTIRKGGHDIEVRTSTLPGPYGESLVLRILNPKTIALTLEQLGMQKPVLDSIVRELNRPNGMILTTGPTGSGKTTTLYAFVKKTNSPDINIITIEDPIEYHLEGVNQTQIDKERGYDFSNGLRSILRQDPDVILVGEIRDYETAEIAMHAALTGHLVFSTLHTNNAPGTIPRLLDLGIKPNIIAPAINVAMAQRLVRVLCAECKISYTPSPEELRHLAAILRDLPSPYKKPPTNISLARARGCDACNGTGYKGRIGVFEVFFIDDDIERMILQSPSESDIREAAKKQGMLSLQQDAALKVFTGITSWEEVERVTGE